MLFSDVCGFRSCLYSLDFFGFFPRIYNPEHISRLRCVLVWLSDCLVVLWMYDENIDEVRDYLVFCVTS